MKINDGLGISLDVVALRAKDQSAFALLGEFPRCCEGEFLVASRKRDPARSYCGNFRNEVANIGPARFKIEGQTCRVALPGERAEPLARRAPAGLDGIARRITPD